MTDCIHGVIYTHPDGTVWHVQMHPDGTTVTRLDTQEDE